VLTPVLAELGRIHPKVCVELLTDARLYSLPRREADLVFRIKPFGEPEGVSRRLLHVCYALYGGVGGALPDVRWLARVLPKATVAFRSNNREVQAQLCARGAGPAVLPRPLRDATPGLIARDIGEKIPTSSIIATLRRWPRLRALLDLVIDRLANLIAADAELLVID
jgi:DNA-binding transcriptional LysR family regulator